MNNIPILILGAGPAGLSLGYQLSERNLPYLVLEKSSEVGSTFYSMTDSTEYGPWVNNTLAGSPVPLGKLLARTTRSEYARYLSEYRSRHNIKVKTNVTVLSASKTESGYEVETDQGMYSCTVLVNATGYYCNPYIPDFSGLQESNVIKLHSAQYRWPTTISDALGKPTGKILIVGSRLSAGELMEELHKMGHEIHLSHRSKIKYWPSPTEEALLSPFSMAWEHIAARINAPKPPNLNPRLRRGFQKSLLDRGIVPTHPNIKEVRGLEVEFENGHTEGFEVLLFCTGYQPALAHLWPILNGKKPEVSNLETKEHENLFFLGYEHGRTIRSQFLRGIRDDARYLAEILQERMRLPGTLVVSKEKPQILPSPSGVTA
ncbi:MAG: NAD(P)-binding domain-containing protein [Vulcanimicrobiota bacterium]